MANCIAVFDPKASCNPAKITGVIEFHQCDPESRTRLTFKLSGCKPKATFGCHVHKCGDLSKGCTSACAHFNPIGTMHGSKYLYGHDRHAGDLMNNLVSDQKGNVNFIWDDELVDLFPSPFSIVGRMIVLHEKADDLGKYRYDDTSQGKESATTGNAGARIACAIIGITDTDFHPK
jgi:Cu-Zn family superoxide dismutase